MTQKTKYPYQLINTFVTSISFNRIAKVPPKLELSTEVAVQLIEPSFPRVQIAMKISAPKNVPDSSPVTFNLEVVGLFDYTGSKKDYDKKLNREFAEERAFHMLWVYSSDIVKMVSAQMGMNPLQLRSPASFNLSMSTQTTVRKKSGSRKRKVTESPA